MDEEGTKEDANLDSGPTGRHDENLSPGSIFCGYQIGWGGGGGGGGANAPRPDTTVDPVADTIVELF